MALSKRLRFEVFKRDHFTCQYCGCTPPVVVLEVDHIIPVSKKGKDDIDNLVTACFDCNRGKSNIELKTLPQTTVQKTAQLKEKEEQYKEYKKILAKIEKRQQNEIDTIDALYTFYFPKYCLSDRFKQSSLRNFIKALGYVETSDAMRIACMRIGDDRKALKYFCGICWNKINKS